MKSEIKKLRLPWDHNDSGLIYGQVNDPDGDDEAPFIADTATVNGDESDEDKERADFIVRACNHHHELIEALQDVIDCEHDRDEESRNFSEERLADYAALIAKAKGAA